MAKFYYEIKTSRIQTGPPILIHYQLH